MKNNLQKLFGIEGSVNTILDEFFSIVALNILFIVCSLPIFTIGMAWHALYQSMASLITKEDAHIYRKYFSQFHQNVRQNLGLSFLMIFWILSLMINLIIFHRFIPMSPFFDLIRILFITVNVFIFLGMQTLFIWYSLKKKPLFMSFKLSILTSYKQLPKIILALVVGATPLFLTFHNLAFMPLIILFCPALLVYVKLKLVDYM
ncbi:DUF624 domain-containing protein [Lederbergia sp. NSJ-179]|uniref:DUF624 domain-containing protein n=1 Tax=Lederbergia sp. NSJ-179 TaxID=2931402 RepID=UPI001FD23A6A|nr:DUF624 domain-containing protein [Lederbergia sp. NSJ-179]MCJ7842131.1 DUF624 domain-containing protein [Lederbergia sp. NSJ-179]